MSVARLAVCSTLCASTVLRAPRRGQVLPREEVAAEGNDVVRLVLDGHDLDRTVPLSRKQRRAFEEMHVAWLPNGYRPRRLHRDRPSLPVSRPQNVNFDSFAALRFHSAIKKSFSMKLYGPL